MQIEEKKKGLTQVGYSSLSILMTDWWFDPMLEVFALCFYKSIDEKQQRSSSVCTLPEQSV